MKTPEGLRGKSLKWWLVVSLLPLTPIILGIYIVIHRKTNEEENNDDKS